MSSGEYNINKFKGDKMQEENKTEETINPGVSENVAPTTPTAEKPELSEEEIAKLNKQKEFFYRLRQGGTFLKFVYNHIEQQKKDHQNRAQRRRFEKELRKGVFSKELVEIYVEKMAEIEAYIEEQMNPKPKAQVVDDPVKTLAELREKHNYEAK